MKRLKLKIGTFFLYFYVALVASASNYGYDIKLSAKNWADSSVILGHYFNKKLLVNDTVKLDHAGNGRFSGVKPLDGGIYFIYMPNKELVDVLINTDQTFEISFNGNTTVSNMMVKGSDETKGFTDYQKFIAEKQKVATPLREAMERNKTNIDSVNFYRLKLEQLDKDVKTYWSEVEQKYPNTFYASFIKAIQEITIPEPFVAFGNVKRDSIIQARKYYYYKEHAFDNVNLSDPRLYFTPFLANKIETFITQTVYQIPDSVTKESVILIEKSRKDETAFKYMLSTLFNLANESKIMGMDKVVVELGERYYLSGLAPWADKEFLSKLSERVQKMKPNLVGNQAPELKLQTEQGEFYKLSEISASFTVLAFWEPECGHCQKEIPKLYNDVFLKYKQKGIKVMAVYTQLKPEPWHKFIEEHGLNEWINVYDPYNLSNYRNLYDVISTPTIYILDKNKKIMAKRIAVEDIPGFFDHYLGNPSNKAISPIMQISEHE